MANFNIFFPLNELNPQGWLNDFITPQLMSDKNSLEYNVVYKDFTFMGDDNEQKLRSIFQDKKTFNNQPLFDSYRNRTAKRQAEEEKFIYINGKYADILENIVTSKTGVAKGNEREAIDLLMFLNSVKPYQLAFFQPYIKLYYGWKDDPKNKKEQFKFIEFPFSQKFELESILSNPNAFLEGSGIKNLSNDIQFNLGTKRNSKISINYYFSNMNILTRDRTKDILEPEKPKYGFSFTKLFSNLGIKKEILKVEYGYYVDPRLENQHNIPSRICEMINEREKKIFGILKTSHNFKFDKEGGLEISVSYVSLADASLESDNSVALPSPERSVNNRIISEAEAEAAGTKKLLQEYHQLKSDLEKTADEIRNLLQKQIESPPNVSKQQAAAVSEIQTQKIRRLQKLKEKEAQQNKDLNLIKRQIIPYFKDLFIKAIKYNYDMYSVSFNTKKNESDKTYSVSANLNLINPDDGSEIKLSDLSGRTYSLNEIARNVQSNLKEENLENILNRLFNTPVNHLNTDKNFGHIIFFPVRAIIRAAYQMLSDEEKEYIPYMLFGNLTVNLYDKSFNINTGNILIELNTFQKWMYHKFYNKGFLDISFGHFIKELIDDLIPEAIYRNRTYPNRENRTTIQDYLTSFSISPDWNTAGLLKEELEEVVSDTAMNMLANNIYNNNTSRDYKPLIIFSKLDLSTNKDTTSQNFSVNTSQELELNETMDAKNGIPHLVIGSDGGMFLNADFQQIDLKGLRSGIALQSMTDNNSSYFFYQYSLSADVIGSGIFNHGSIVCIPTPPLGLVGADYDIGIVGYYKIKGLKDSISADGNYKSNINADWFWGGKRDGKNGQPITENGKIGKKPNEIFDSISPEVYDPNSYIDLLIKTDINTLANFKIDNKSQNKKDKNTTKKKETRYKRKDEKEKDRKK